MKVVILAAGEGKRLRPHTNAQPKCMVKFSNKSLVERMIDQLVSLGVERRKITLVTGYMHQKLDFLETIDFHN